jgi:exosome complex component RRP4
MLTSLPPSKRRRVLGKDDGGGRAHQLTRLLPAHSQSPPSQTANGLRVVGPGEGDVLRGHGTYTSGHGRLLSCVSGVLERINKLVTVQPRKARYVGEVGDVVIGRITEVLPRRWKVDINATVMATLLLGAVQLPDSAQRRRTHQDELEMRKFYAENDLVAAEIQEYKQDRSLMLHTRANGLHGKLTAGLLVVVPSNLIKRLKHHFHQLPCGVALILGCNGYVWVAPPTSRPPTEAQAGPEGHSDVGNVGASAYAAVSLSTREAVCRVRNAVSVLAASGLAIFPDTVMDTYTASHEHGLSSAEMLQVDHMGAVTAKARARLDMLQQAT